MTTLHTGQLAICKHGISTDDVHRTTRGLCNAYRCGQPHPFVDTFAKWPHVSIAAHFRFESHTNRFRVGFLPKFDVVLQRCQEATSVVYNSYLDASPILLILVILCSDPHDRIERSFSPSVSECVLYQFRQGITQWSMVLVVLNVRHIEVDRLRASPKNFPYDCGG